jgi:hypothetical protein
MCDRVAAQETAMHPAAPATVRHLARDQVLRLNGPLDIVSRAGTLWITIDGELQDIVLEPGEARRFDRGAALLVCALGNDADLETQPLATRRRHPLAARAVERLSGLARAWTAPRPLGARP